MSTLNLRSIIPTTLGTILEWAEYTFFAYMADHLSTLFFPIENPDLARLKTYGIFGASYFMRPVGALIFGTIGDKVGRKPALIASMVLMSIATTTIGLLPTHQYIGALAPIFLILCRLLQGIAVAGEFSGSAVFIFEHNNDRPFFSGSFTSFAAAAGMSVGAFAATLVSLPNAPDFSWRIPFLCSGVLSIVAIYLRKNVTETPAFLQTKTKSTPLNTLFSTRENLIALLCTAAMAFFVSTYVYIGNIYYKTLCVNIGGLTPHLAAQIVTAGQLLTALLILAFGSIADQLNGKKLCLMGLGLAIFLGPIILACAQSGEIALSMIGQLFYAFLNGMITAPMMTLLLRKFPPEIRYRGKSFAWNTTAAIFGGTALLTAETLMHHYGQIGLGLYVSVAALSAFLALGLTSSYQPSSEPTEARDLPAKNIA